MKKTIYSPDEEHEFKNKTGQVHACYIPRLVEHDKQCLEQLNNIPFTRVHYISRFRKANRTPRLTWCYGQVNTYPETIEYRGLNFRAEKMPSWLEELSLICRKICIEKYDFDPNYNSCIIGRYDSGDDQIAFHKDDETFLEHHFCANITLGSPRDFQFKDDQGKVHEIKLEHGSVFFFLALEHALPKRKRSNNVRYSISFRNIAKNVGIGNFFYYCRGLEGAIDDEKKQKYIKELKLLQTKSHG